VNHLDDLLPELALGCATPAERRSAEAHLATCARCRQALSELEDAATSFAAVADQRAPTESVRERLLASAARPGIEAFADLLARVFDLDVGAAGRVLARAADPAAWRPGPLPGSALLPFRPGPRRAGADATLFRFGPGLAFPRHGHRGPETVLVLEGGFTDDAGCHRAAGERIDTPPGASHAFVVDEGGCITAVLIDGGIVLAE
jgi:putative transcriptional regulator